MRISELSRATGVPIATVKFYLREGLLPAGRATAATQADYDETHVRRLRLVRALVEVGGLSLAAVRDVLAAMAAGPDLEAVGAAHGALPPGEPGDRPPSRALAMVEELGWCVDPRSRSLHRLESALATLDEVGLAPSAEKAAAYADAALAMARADIASVPRGDLADVVEYVVVGTILYEPVVLALRRLAQQHLFVASRPEG